MTLQHHNNDEVSESSSLSSTSSDGMPLAAAPKYDCSVSAPVSRQNSDESNVAQSATNRLAVRWNANCCTPLKFVSHAAKQLAAHVDVTSTDGRKTVAWDDAQLLNIEEISNPGTPIQQNSAEYKSRYKSEPNLSYASEVVNSAAAGAQVSVTKYANGSRSLTRKLMKGVSMGNLKFSFATPESTKRLVRTVSSTLRRRSAGDDELPKVGAHNKAEQLIAVAASESLEDLDDENFVDNPNDQLDSDSESAVDDDEEEGHEEADNYESAYRAVHDIGVTVVDGRSSNSNSSDNSNTRYHKQLLLQQCGVYRSMELITSTPSLLLGRRSMSPITKSTQRMPKSMQVSAWIISFTAC